MNTNKSTRKRVGNENNFGPTFTAPLYLKASILEASKAETYWKSDRFVPTISARWDPKSASVKLAVYKANLDKVSIYISLGCKTKMAKKEILGKVSIDAKSPNADTWRECLRQPGVPKTFWVNFEWHVVDVLLSACICMQNVLLCNVFYEGIVDVGCEYRYNMATVEVFLREITTLDITWREVTPRPHPVRVVM